MASDTEERRERLAELLPHQQEDFEGLFEAMAGLPVTIRLLDPPLHEFLPHPDDLPEGPERDRAASLQEVNPMLGTRGCRLGILYPEIYEMQVEAIVRAALAVRDRTGDKPHLEVMIPLVDYEREIELLRDYVEQTAEREGLEQPADYTIGTMIELPRACFLADHIAEFADFFSFGTNDLTQTAFGFSRDDIGKFVGMYEERKLVPANPFVTVDKPGVGRLMRIAVEEGKAANAALHLGICGEHGGDPASVVFCHELGLDYVSCSPFRVETARLAAGQAAVGTAEVASR
jgi:pyruvate,orthophosphate dikinase